MLYRGWHLAKNMFCPSLRHAIAKTHFVFAQSKTGCIHDENMFNETFSNEFSKPAPKGEFYKSALTSLEIIGPKESEFFMLHDALCRHGFLSKKNFYALQRGQAFDEHDNVVAKTFADIGI